MNRLEKFNKIYRKIIAEQAGDQEEMNLGDIKKNTITVETYHKVKLGDKEYEITNVVVNYTPENDGIGSYEYWGSKEYDKGKDYIKTEGIAKVELLDLADDKNITLDWEAEMKKSDSEYKDLFKDGFDKKIYKFVESNADEIFKFLDDEFRQYDDER